MNPFELKPAPLDHFIQDWSMLYPKPYDKKETDPYTKTRVILMNGTEFENVWFGHQFQRHCPDNDLRRRLALLRRLEQQQQKKIGNLKPLNETILEHTISYEQLAVDLTARMAQDEKDPVVKNALDFALLEDFDHLYRYADLLDMESGIHAEDLVGRYTEIMPGRPTISEHRYPFEAVNFHINDKTAAPETKLHVNIITAAEQQTMNFYMNAGPTYATDLGRKLYQEIAMIEEQHVSEYGSLIDPTCTWLECLLMHQYVECYLYYSCMSEETDTRVKPVWEQCFEQEVAHLHEAKELLYKYEQKDWQQVIPDGTFPKLLNLGPNIDYVRDVLAGTVWQTKQDENYVNVKDLPADDRFFQYQERVNPRAAIVPSHQVIDTYLSKNQTDYRFETAPNPIPELQDRKADNTAVGR
jgi:hypothetical protein